MFDRRCGYDSGFQAASASDNTPTTDYVDSELRPPAPAETLVDQVIGGDIEGGDEYCLKRLDVAKGKNMEDSWLYCVSGILSSA